MKVSRRVFLIVFQKMPEDGDGGRTGAPQGKPRPEAKAHKSEHRERDQDQQAGRPEVRLLEDQGQGKREDEERNDQVPEAIAQSYFHSP